MVTGLWVSEDLAGVLMAIEYFSSEVKLSFTEQEIV